MTQTAPTRASHRVVIEVPPWFAALADRGVQAIAVLVGGALGGFVALGLSWSGLAARVDPGLQIPFLVSGAFGGVALAGAALGIVNAQLDRRQNAVDRFYMDDVVRDVAAISEALPAVVAARLRERAVAARAASANLVGLVSNGRTLHTSDCRMAAGKGLPAFEGALTGDLKACRICQPAIDV